MGTEISRLNAAIEGIEEIQRILQDPLFADRSSVAGQTAQVLASRFQDLTKTIESVRVDLLLPNLHPRRAFASMAGLSTAAASGWTILNTQIGAIAGSIGLGSTVLLGTGAAIFGGAVGGGVGYGIHRGLKAVQGRSLGALYYDNDVLSARSFAQWTTEHELTDVSGWF